MFQSQGCGGVLAPMSEVGNMFKSSNFRASTMGSQNG